MPVIRYEQLSTKTEFEDVTTNSTKTRNKKCFDGCVQRGSFSLALILLYFSLSIGLTFYQRWLLKEFQYPLTVVLYHLVVKWLLSVIVRTLLHLVTGIPQLVLPFMTCVRSVGPTGLASGIDVGFSNWGLELVTISLYTMTKSTTIIFILLFAIVLGLEKKSWSLVGIVLMISAGLIMFTYKATQFNVLGFNFLLLASFAGGLRWTFAQLLMQKSKLGLHNPIDMVFHVQPWMFISLLPFMLAFEDILFAPLLGAGLIHMRGYWSYTSTVTNRIGRFGCFYYLNSLPPGEFFPTLLKISVGATIAFAMELSEFLVVTYTSSLTLSVAGIFKEMWILVLAVEVGGDQLSAINVVGLGVCLLGISGHIVHKLIIIKQATAAANASNVWSMEECRERDAQSRAISSHSRRQEHEQPLMEGDSPERERWHNSQEADSQDSDVDSNLILYEVVQRRDALR